MRNDQAKFINNIDTFKHILSHWWTQPRWKILLGLNEIIPTVLKLNALSANYYSVKDRVVIYFMLRIFWKEEST